VKRARRRCSARAPLESGAATGTAAPAETVAPLLDDKAAEWAGAGEPPAPASPPPPLPAVGSCLGAAAAQLVRPAVAEAFAVLLAAGQEEVVAFFPLFASGGGAAAVATVVVLPVLSAAWLALAYALALAPGVAAAAERYGEAAEPWLLIAVAVYCLVGSWVIPVTAPWQ